MAKRKRKHYSLEEKTAILGKHFLERAPVSDLCDQHGLHPTMLYRWQKEFFENGAAAFKKETTRQERAARERILKLEAKLRRKDEVLSELMEEHVQLKKELGEL